MNSGISHLYRKPNLGLSFLEQIPCLKAWSIIASTSLGLVTSAPFSLIVITPLHRLKYHKEKSANID
jgi:hypothetical protein